MAFPHPVPVWNLAPVTTYTRQVFALRCRNCGQTGHLWLTENAQRDWSFATVGFVGLAVNRHNPPNSVIRCNGCGSPQVVVVRDVTSIS